MSRCTECGSKGECFDFCGADSAEVIDKIDALEKELQVEREKLAEAVEALRFYANPYNYTPNRDAMYGKYLNDRAWKALAKIEKEKEAQGEKT
jgi:hypothetical protein